LENIKIDGILRKIAHPKDMESLKTSAESVVEKIDSIRHINFSGNILPEKLIVLLSSKYQMIHLLVDVLNGKALDEQLFINVHESLTGCLSEESKGNVDRIGIILRRLSFYNSLEEMKQDEEKIRKSMKEFFAIDGNATRHVLKYMSDWELGRDESLKQLTQKILSSEMKLGRKLFGNLKKIGCPIEESEKLCYFTVRTERGKRNGTEREYLEKYARSPRRGGSLMWINLISGDFSVRFKRKRKQVEISPQRMQLLYIFLRHYEKLVLISELQEVSFNYAQVIDDLDEAVLGQIKPFLATKHGHGKTLMRSGIRDHRRKFTFCLIERCRAEDNPYEPYYG